MEVLKDDFSELEMGTSVDSFKRFVDSQKELFHNQIDELQRIVVAQCKLTGVNPLSQEMVRACVRPAFVFSFLLFGSREKFKWNYSLSATKPKN
jgi:hypothetical protein